jgi:hypothetical protein
LAHWYRIARHNPAIREDFLSHEALGKRRPTRVSEKDWAGVSMLDSMDNAIRLATRRRDLGSYIAVLDLPGSIARERSGPIPGHHNVWASPDELFARVVETIPVESLQASEQASAASSASIAGEGERQ